MTVVGMEDLPAKCVAQMIAQTSPADAQIGSASDSVDVSNKFLMLSDCKYNDDVSMSSKKDPFLRPLHKLVLIEHAKKSFWLDKWSGKRCHMISAREFEITGSEIPQDWNWINLPESRFEEAAELILVGRLEIQWKMDTALLSPATNYAAYLVLKWQGTQVLTGVSGNAFWTSIVRWEPDFDQVPNFGMGRCPAFANLDRLRHPREREDGWMEIEVGDYFNDKGDDGELQMGVIEMTSAKGLILQGIEIRPYDKLGLK